MTTPSQPASFTIVRDGVRLQTRECAECNRRANVQHNANQRRNRPRWDERKEEVK